MKKILFLLFFCGIVSAQDFEIDGSTFTIHGELEYEFKHLVASADSVSVTTTIGTQFAYFKMLPGMTEHDNLGFVLAGDTVTVLNTGDYIIHFAITASGANLNDRFRIKLYTNAQPHGTEIGRMSWKVTSAGQQDTKAYFWYMDLTANDVLSFRVTNLTAARDLTITDMKIMITRAPED